MAGSELTRGARNSDRSISPKSKQFSESEDGSRQARRGKLESSRGSDSERRGGSGSESERSSPRGSVGSAKRRLKGIKEGRDDRERRDSSEEEKVKRVLDDRDLKARRTSSGKAATMQLAGTRECFRGEAVGLKHFSPKLSCKEYAISYI
jgi:hypothetical protein